MRAADEGEGNICSRIGKVTFWLDKGYQQSEMVRYWTKHICNGINEHSISGRWPECDCSYGWNVRLEENSEIFNMTRKEFGMESIGRIKPRELFNHDADRV